MEHQKYGTLLTPDIRINRQYFREMCKLLGIRVLYRAPKIDKSYTTWREIEANYEEPIMIGCIFDEHPTQQTLKKIGWVSELNENSSFIHVDYDLKGLQQGALFIIPSGLDDGKGRVFRVVKMVNEIVYPSSITCEIVPEYTDDFESVSGGKTVEELVESENLNIFNDEVIKPMTNEIQDLEEQLQLNGD